ncbi:Trehalase [Portunus trituberculatus]|uniref:Trehalase n=1 Tax=Portunus trituberculatus TaxID=210409 RepID=A0A5B7J752_PORTR|nr:Trehalase [Portunus trituberculatus]
MWKQLGRKISTTVKDNPEKHSQIYVPNPVIVPGGRFREFYYWDSYWTIEGLLLSGMNHTVKGMLENFLMMVKTYGMVPNGGRIYYTRRSQPPYLIPMFKLYMDHHFDQDFLRSVCERESGCVSCSAVIVNACIVHHWRNYFLQVGAVHGGHITWPVNQECTVGKRYEMIRKEIVM